MADTTNITKVFCLGDGYAHGHIWPEWPQILQALRPDLKVVVISAIGAGHEFLINELLNNDVTNSVVIFQWPAHDRFDKLVQDSSWDSIIKSDVVYHFNTYNTHQGTWWCSSSSNTDIIQQYHSRYIQDQQSVIRQDTQKTLVESYMASHNARYVATSNADQEHFARTTNFSHLLIRELQPLPLLHYHWVVQSIMPAAGLQVNTKIAQELLNRLSSHTWTQYGPDNKEIWTKMSRIDL